MDQRLGGLDKVLSVDDVGRLGDRREILGDGDAAMQEHPRGIAQMRRVDCRPVAAPQKVERHIRMMTDSVPPYLAVDDTVRDRLVQMEGIAPYRVETLYNTVDLLRIPQRNPLAPKPRRALAFTKFKAQIPYIQEACRRRGVELDVLGAGGDRLVLDPERELIGYDLVFATARMALEALCAGCAVVVCDSRGLADLVTQANFADLRRLNFGLRALTRPVSVESLGQAPGQPRPDARPARDDLPRGHRRAPARPRGGAHRDLRLLADRPAADARGRPLALDAGARRHGRQDRAAGARACGGPRRGASAPGVTAQARRPSFRARFAEG